MRPILCLIGTALLMASIWWYTDFAGRVKASATTVNLQQARGEYSAEITCTFECETNARFDLSAIEVRLADQVVIARTDALPRLNKLVVEHLPQVFVGRNEIIVQAHVAETGDVPESGCLRIQIFRDGAPIGDETFWSEPGQPLVTGALMFSAAEISNAESP